MNSKHILPAASFSTLKALLLRKEFLFQKKGTDNHTVTEVPFNTLHKLRTKDKFRTRLLESLKRLVTCSHEIKQLSVNGGLVFYCIEKQQPTRSAWLGRTDL